MTSELAPRLALLALAPLLLFGALRPSADADAHVQARAGGDVPQLQLAALKAEARSLAVHIDGP